MKSTPERAQVPKNGSTDARLEPDTGHSIASFLNELEAARKRILQPLQHANERCIEILVQAARAADKGALPLVTQLREVLTRLTPEIRARAAGKPFLLVDFQFGNDVWWQELRSNPARPSLSPSGPGTLPRASAVNLGRATLMLAWHSVRADVNASCLLGISPSVAATLASFSLTDLDRIAERWFRNVRPRWEDRPSVWRQLLLSASTPDARQVRDAHLRALQLLTGELISARLNV